MALHKLQVDDFYDDSYTLIAIHCRLEDYRLAYLLNKHLELRLERKDQDVDFKYLESSYSIFEWDNETEYVLWNLISNVCKKEEDSLLSSGTLFDDNEKVLKTFYLISEYKKVDFFLKISEESHNFDENSILSKLKSIPQIITSYTVDPLKIKSKDHLIF
ncbi:IPExxxVDY family protein [Winogradskyella undariae]|uniref:IPExxxVDY family protein n=1 Tax=Winogradskyella TaxID=286104 RepID=UPI00156B1E2B|nr:MULTISPECIES: IPExxxVDY family protein [Winogradskyella]NRR91300.1 IPExxxVDY family protein [Winogradskyella undariae]QXP80481.1 IPExxxVDY family protein [Winogradskyella sp. HaHa_3_26]